MKRDPKDLQRYTARERVNHWLVGICFILLALSGLALFHPAFWPLAQLFGGGTWTRILHPYVGVLLALSFLAMALRFWKLNVMTRSDREWLRRADEMLTGDDHNLPAQGKYNAGQKVLFWALLVCVALLALSGLALWRVWFILPVDLVRLAAVIHAAAATAMICLIIVHVYAAIWVRGTIRAMWTGTVTRAWAKQHHRAWYRAVTGAD